MDYKSLYESAKILYESERKAHTATKVLKDRYYRDHLYVKEGKNVQRLGVDFECFIHDYTTMLRAHAKMLNPWEKAAHILGVEKKDVMNGKFIKQRYKKIAKLCHPDKGGSIEEFQALKDAFDKLIKDVVEAESRAKRGYR